MSSKDLHENLQMEIEVGNRTEKSKVEGVIIPMDVQMETASENLQTAEAKADEYDASRISFDGLDLNVMMKLATSTGTGVELAAIRAMRKLTVGCQRNESTIDNLVNVGALQVLVNCLQRYDNPRLQREAAWALINIAAGSYRHTRAVVTAGAVPLLTKLIQSSNVDVARNAVWALSNIMADSAEYRDLIVRHNLIPKILQLIRPDLPLPFLRTIVWAISNLCFRTSPLSWAISTQILPVLRQLIHHSDVEVLKDALRALSNLAGRNRRRIQMVLDSNVLHRVIFLLSQRADAIVAEALKVIVALTSVDDGQVQVVLDNGLLKHLPPLLIHSNEEVVQKALWVISNVTAGDHTQIQEVIDAGLIPAVIRQLRSGKVETQEIAARVVSNFTDLATAEQMTRLINDEVIPPLFDLLTANSSELLRDILDALHRILGSPGYHYIPIAT